MGLAVLVCPDAQAGRRRLAALRIPAMRSDAAPPMAKRRRLWSLSSHAAAVSPSTASRDLVGRTRAILGSAVVPRVVCAPANNLAESAGAHWNAAAAPASSTMRVGRSMYALKLRRVRVLYPEYVAAATSCLHKDVKHLTDRTAWMATHAVIQDHLARRWVAGRHTFPRARASGHRAQLRGADLMRVCE